MSRALSLSLGALVVLALAGILVPATPHFGLDGAPGFGALFGLAAAAGAAGVALIWGRVARGEGSTRDDD